MGSRLRLQTALLAVAVAQLAAVQWRLPDHFMLGGWCCFLLQYCSTCGVHLGVPGRAAQAAEADWPVIVMVAATSSYW